MSTFEYQSRTTGDDPLVGRRPSRTRLAVTSVVVLALLEGSAAHGALAATKPAPVSDADTTLPSDADDHSMGSQIRRAEGTAPGDNEPSQVSPQSTVRGMDVSRWQGNVNWPSWWAQGMRFAYVKATEGTTYRNPYFAQQYNGSYNTGFIRGAYHFALPNRSSGATQANVFVSNGGGWSRDGKTLPGALDMEYNPYGSACYGLSKLDMVAWIKSFSDTYHTRTGRWPTIYTSTSWWTLCTGSYGGGFSATNPLWVARYSSSPGTLPYRWGYYTFWQYTSSPIDKDLFNGSYDRLRVLATG